MDPTAAILIKWGLDMGYPSESFCWVPHVGTYVGAQPRILQDLSHTMAFRRRSASSSALS